MEKYKNLSGSSGITGYTIATESITVEFNHDTQYLYTYKSTGRQAIEQMKKLALKGRGLSTYISRHVCENFEKKLK